MSEIPNHSFHRGTRIGPAIVNPGTGPVDGASFEQAQQNINAFVADLYSGNINPDAPAISGPIDIRPAEQPDGGDGRFAFVLSHNEREVEVDMPGLPVEQVRYLRGPRQNIWDFPRLYVDGGSWVWYFALSCTHGGFYPEADEDE